MGVKALSRGLQGTCCKNSFKKIWVILHTGIMPTLQPVTAETEKIISTFNLQNAPYAFTLNFRHYSSENAQNSV